MLILPTGRIRVNLHCDRCGTMRHDGWAPKTGAIEARNYAYSDAYKQLLEDDRATVRLGMLKHGKPQPISADARKQLTPKTPAKGADDEGKGTGLQLLRGKRKGHVRDRPRRRKGRHREGR